MKLVSVASPLSAQHDVFISLCKQTNDLSIGYHLISTCASIIVLNLKIWRVGSKFNLRPSNLQLMAWSFQIKYSYVHLRLEDQSNALAHVLMRWYPIDKSFVCLQSEIKTSCCALSGDATDTNFIVFGDLMVANWTYCRRVKFLNSIQWSPF
jgi:hypothetical protein